MYVHVDGITVLRVCRVPDLIFNGMIQRADYEMSNQIVVQDFPFYALIMAAMRQADTDNLAKLQRAWPDVYRELFGRHNAPGGLLPGEEGLPTTG